MNNAQYWKNRALILEESLWDTSSLYTEEIEKAFARTSRQIQDDILAWYQRFANNNGITLSQAKQQLNTKQLKELRWSVEDYIKAGEESSISGKWKKELENASARAHINRLEALQLQMQQKIEVLYGNQVDDIDALLRDIYQEGYYRTAFDIQHEYGVGWILQQFDDKTLDKILSKPWSTDNMTFRDRCWKNKDVLVSELHSRLLQATIRGDAPHKIADDIASRFQVAKHKAQRLVRTETSYFGAQSRKDSYQELGVEQCQIVETLDSHTCATCQGLDGKVVSMADYSPGVTVPPFHPNCRGTTAPYFEDEDGERAARSPEGKVYYVPAGMKYPEWKTMFVSPGKDGSLSKVYQAMQQYITSDGFHVAEANRDYKKFLQSVPDKNRMYLEQSLDSVAYVEHDSRSFGYSFLDDAIYYPKDIRLLDGLDFAVVNTHELAHRIDAYFVKSHAAQPFLEAIESARSILDKSPEYYTEYCNAQDLHGLLSDLLDAVCADEYPFPYYHAKEYWAQAGKRAQEVFANLFALESIQDTEKLSFIKEHFPGLWEAYQGLEYSV